MMVVVFNVYLVDILNVVNMRTIISLLGEAYKVSTEPDLKVVWGKDTYSNIEFDRFHIKGIKNETEPIIYPITADENRYLIDCYSQYLHNIES